MFVARDHASLSSGVLGIVRCCSKKQVVRPNTMRDIAMVADE
jgi:hypothetical protein